MNEGVGEQPGAGTGVRNLPAGRNLTVLIYTALFYYLLYTYALVYLAYIELTNHTIGVKYD